MQLTPYFETFFGNRCIECLKLKEKILCFWLKQTYIFRSVCCVFYFMCRNYDKKKFFINALKMKICILTYILIIVEYFSNDLVVSVYFFAVAAIITNSNSISEIFCDQDLVNHTLIPECDFKCIDVSIHSNEANFATFI